MIKEEHELFVKLTKKLKYIICDTQKNVSYIIAWAITIICMSAIIAFPLYTKRVTENKMLKRKRRESLCV